VPCRPIQQTCCPKAPGDSGACVRHLARGGGLRVALPGANPPSPIGSPLVSMSSPRQVRVRARASQSN
jgi:hypothetical protein